MLLKHPYQAINNLNKARIPAPYRGRPELRSEGVDKDTLKKCVQMCPTGAVAQSPFSIDMGKCIFCGECERMMPKNIHFTQSWRIWSLTRQGLIVTADDDTINLKEFKPLRRPLFNLALKLRQVCAGGDGAAEMELTASDNVNFDMRHYGISFTASPRHADGLVLTGPITRGMADALRITYDAIPEPKVLILVGADAISGGLFAQSSEIDRSFLEGKQVNLYVAGNPPHPLAFIGGVRDLISRR